MKFTLTPDYHEMTIHFTLEGMELRFENLSGDIWVVAFDANTYDVLANALLACYGISTPDGPDMLLAEQEEIPF